MPQLRSEGQLRQTRQFSYAILSPYLQEAPLKIVRTNRFKAQI
jgi:hypothetical protein